MSRRVINSIFVIVFLVAFGAGIWTSSEITNGRAIGVHEKMKEEHSDGKFEGGRPEDGSKGEEFDSRPPEENGVFRGETKDSASRLLKVSLVIEVLVLAGCVMYMILSLGNARTFAETFQNGDKIAIFVLGVACLSMAVLGVLSYNFDGYGRKNFKENEQTEKDVKKEDVEKGEIVREENIDLSKYDSNITINESGTYTIKGKFQHLILVDADESVTLNLDGVEIENNTSAAIANASENELVINLVEDSNNILRDGGSSEYDACLYSEGKLTIEGDGNLKIYGKQEEGEGIATESQDIVINGGNIEIESVDDGINAGGDGGLITINDGSIFIKASGDGIDSNGSLKITGGVVYTMGSPKGGDAGIDTDDGFTIDGGTVIALGVDMLEYPKNKSLQNVLCFTSSEKIKARETVSLVSESNEEVVSFVAQEDFKTLIISDEKLKEGKYHLYVGGKHSGKLLNYIYEGGKYSPGEKLKVADRDVFTVKGTITSIK